MFMCFSACFFHCFYDFYGTLWTHLINEWIQLLFRTHFT